MYVCMYIYASMNLLHHSAESMCSKHNFNSMVAIKCT